MANVKKQHYVPRFYLKHFAEDNKKQLFVLDKISNSISQQNINDICEQNYYYTFKEMDEYNFMLEDHLSKKETKFSDVINMQIKNTEDYYFHKTGVLKTPNHNEKRILLEFICYQILRVPKFIESLFSMNLPEFKRFNEEDGIIQNEKEIRNEIKKYVFPYLFDKVDFIISILNKKNWKFLILSNDLNATFISSDNPIMITNSDINSPIRGALIDPMTEIAIPLSKNIALTLKQNELKYKLNYTLINSSDYVDYANNLLIKNSFRYAYSGNKLSLKPVIKI
jgi:hypothetical protein